MARSRWTVVLLSHDGRRTRSVSLSRPALRFLGATAGVAAGLLLAAAVGIVAHSVRLYRGWRLERANLALRSEVTRIGQRAGQVSDRLAATSRLDDQARLVVGLRALSAAVKRAGIGGPPGPWPDRDRVLTEAGSAGREALAVHVELDVLLRRANIVAASLHEAAESLTAHTRQIEATPSIMPTAGSISSRFARERFHPILHVVLPHEGMDIAAPLGTPILAPAAGRVVKVGWDAGYGLMVVIDHGFGIETRYAHMSDVVVRPGREVQGGDLLGFVGSTGLSTGPHVHYEVRVNGRPVDPLQFVVPDDFGG